MSNIQFWLSFNNGAERIQLPVNPERISITNTHGYDDVTISQLGEYTITGEKRLKEFTFSSFLPRDYNEGYCEYTSLPEPWNVIETLERWKDSRQPMRLTVTGTPINEAVTIRQFDYDPDRAGNPGDIHFSLTLKQFRFIQINKIESKPATKRVASSNQRPNQQSKSKTYTVKSGDTLYKIASNSKTLGDGSKWEDLYAANESTIGKNPNLIKPGQTLVIPNV